MRGVKRDCLCLSMYRRETLLGMRSDLELQTAIHSSHVNSNGMIPPTTEMRSIKLALARSPVSVLGGFHKYQQMFPSDSLMRFSFPPDSASLWYKYAQPSNLYSNIDA